MSVALTQGLRNSLNSLNDIDRDITRTTNRLATGKKVNSAFDNPQVFFQARGFTDKAADLSQRQDNINVGLKTVKLATDALGAIEKAVSSLIGIAESARSLSNTAGTRSALALQFNTVLSSIGDIVKDANFNGTNLLSTTTVGLLKISTDATSGTSINIDSIQSGNVATGLFGAAAIAATTATSFDGAGGDTLLTTLTGTGAGSLRTGLDAARTRAQSFSSSATVIQARLEFNRAQISINKSASDDLVNADLNEEGANLTALQNRQSLAVTALSLSSRSDQAILRLF
ncbi:MAG: flagellin [Beijerinckiaceae bacterium]